jgi:hypothetical protein
LGFIQPKRRNYLLNSNDQFPTIFHKKFGAVLGQCSHQSLPEPTAKSSDKISRLAAVVLTQIPQRFRYQRGWSTQQQTTKASGNWKSPSLTISNSPS